MFTINLPGHMFRETRCESEYDWPEQPVGAYVVARCGKSGTRDVDKVFGSVVEFFENRKKSV